MINDESRGCRFVVENECGSGVKKVWKDEIWLDEGVFVVCCYYCYLVDYWWFWGSVCYSVVYICCDCFDV